MLPIERRNKITETLQMDKKVIVSNLSSQFGVTEETIRRDLEKLEKEFDGDLNKMLAAYNGGSGNVNKWLRDEEYSKDGKNLDKIPFKETENYVKKVKADYEAYKKIYESINGVNEGYDSSLIEYIYILKDHIKNILK